MKKLVPKNKIIVFDKSLELGRFSSIHIIFLTCNGINLWSISRAIKADLPMNGAADVP